MIIHHFQPTCGVFSRFYSQIRIGARHPTLNDGSSGQKLPKPASSPTASEILSEHLEEASLKRAQEKASKPSFKVVQTTLG